MPQDLVLLPDKFCTQYGDVQSPSGSALCR